MEKERTFREMFQEGVETITEKERMTIIGAGVAKLIGDVKELEGRISKLEEKGTGKTLDGMRTLDEILETSPDKLTDDEREFLVVSAVAKMAGQLMSLKAKISGLEEKKETKSSGVL